MNKFFSSKINNLLFYYCLALAILLTLGAAYSAQKTSVIPLVLFLPVTVYFLGLFLVRINRRHIPFPYHKFLSTLNLYYCFIIVTVMTISGLVGAKNPSQLASGVIFLPVAGYFILRVLPKRKRAIDVPVIVLEPKELKRLRKQVGQKSKRFEKLPRIDVDRRQFLKLISSAGLSLFLFSIFAKKAQAAFFGSVPGPGTVALKDISGVQINPAQKQPTDGYKITQMDETSDAPNTYFGYLNKDGAWFIMKDDGSGNYRYKKGASGFTDADTGWPKRKDLTYGYFDVIFD